MCVETCLAKSSVPVFHVQRSFLWAFLGPFYSAFEIPKFWNLWKCYVYTEENIPSANSTIPLLAGAARLDQNSLLQTNEMGCAGSRQERWLQAFGGQYDLNTTGLSGTEHPIWQDGFYVREIKHPTEVISALSFLSAISGALLLTLSLTK